MQKQSCEHFLTKINKKFNQNLLAFQGSILWAGINKERKTLNLYSFKRKLKQS